MQLILETEPSLDIQRDMSTVEETLNEKIVANGDVEDLNKKGKENKENLVEGSITSEEIIKVSSDDIGDSVLTTTLVHVNNVDVANNYRAVASNNSESLIEGEQNGESDVLIPKLQDKKTEKYEILEHSANVIQEDIIEDDIINLGDSNHINAELSNIVEIDTENIPEKIDEEKCIAATNKLDNNDITEKSVIDHEDLKSIRPESSEDITNEAEECISLNEVSEAPLCDDVIIDEETARLNEPKDINVDKPTGVDEETSKDVAEIPVSNKEESEPIELNDEMDVDEVEEIVEENNDVNGTITLRGESDESSIDLTDAKHEINAIENQKTNISNQKDTEDTETIELKDEVNTVQGTEGTEKAESDICDSNVIKESEHSAIVEQDVIGVVEVRCVTEEPKINICSFAKMDEDVKESPIELKDEIDVEEIKDVQENKSETNVIAPSPAKPMTISDKPVISKLVNNLNILSDDEDEPPSNEPEAKDAQSKETTSSEQPSINIEDDDDIMLIDEDVPSTTEITKAVESIEKVMSPSKQDSTPVMETVDESKQSDDLFSNSNDNEKESTLRPPAADPSIDINIKEKPVENDPVAIEPDKPLLPDNFLKSAKKNLADMTREDLEEFCILKIVESIVDRSSLSDIKAKLIVMSQNIEEYKKKASMLTKQNRDLQVVLKSVQEEQKKFTDVPVAPLKITRSVGMQILMTDKLAPRRKGMMPQNNTPSPNHVTKPVTRNPAGVGPRAQKQAGINQNIPVPRLVPASSPTTKPPSAVNQPAQGNTPIKSPNLTPNGIKNLTPALKAAEKRLHNRIQSVTVDLTDDEPPAKMCQKNSPAPPVRLVPPQNLMPPQRQPFTPVVNTPRKVYIPISGPQNQAIRPGQTIMLKPVTGPRQRCPPPPQVPRAQNPVRRVTSGRHPAPLPDAMKQYQPPNWKALPPAPDLRLSKVENGIVISWKIEGYQEDSYEEIASYQLYAYQETSSPPSTSLWKKIGDVKALPLPMACTLTQFMAGFKYYFAVRAVDVKSRLGPFSLPGSILLLNKL